MFALSYSSMIFWYIPRMKKKLHGKQKTICELTTQSFPSFRTSSSGREVCTYFEKGDLHLFYRRNKGVGRLVVSETPEQSRFSKSQFMESTDGEQLEERTFK